MFDLWRWFELRYAQWFLIGLFLAHIGCTKTDPPTTNTTNTTSPPNTRKAASSNASSQPALPRAVLPKATLDPTWWPQSWLAAIVSDYKVLFPLLGPQVRGTETHRAAMALRKNDLMAYLKKPVDPKKKMSRDAHILRGRLLLRAARFYAELSELVLALSEDVFSQRFALRNRLQIGQLLPLYRGRLFCLRKNFKAAQEQWTLAEKITPPNRRSRLAFWKALCQDTPLAQKNSLLEQSDFSKDPDNWADWSLARAFFGLSPNNKPQTPTPRAELYLALTQDAKTIAYDALRSVMDEETIKEGDVDATLEYYDPGLPWLLAQYHARKALHAFQQIDPSDPSAALGQAEAFALLGSHKQATQAVHLFLKTPPKQIDWAMQVFSPFLTPNDLLLRARLLHLRLLSSTDKTAHKTAQDGLQQLHQQHPHCPARLWIAETSLYRENTPKHYNTILACADLSTDLLKQLQTSIDQQTDGAKYVAQNRLTRYALRAFFQTAAQSALFHGDRERAVRWFEFLHQKDQPYQIGGDNQAAQILSTTRAYLRMSRWGVAYFFLGKNRQTYPSLTQPWALLGTLRIFRGMSANDGGGGPGPKGD